MVSSESYDALLKAKLKQLHEVLLKAHEEETKHVKEQLANSLQSFAVRVAPSDASVDLQDEVPREREALHSAEQLRWQTITKKLLERDRGDTPRDGGVIALGEEGDLHMRPTWCHSVLQKRVKVSSKSRSTYNEDMQLRMNASIESRSSKFVLGPQSSFQLAWALMSCVLITWDLLTIPMEAFNNVDFSNMLRYVSYFSLAFWVIDMPLHLIFGVQRKGLVELRPEVLCKVYMKTWFLVDLLIISIDVALIMVEASLGRSMSFLQSMRFLRSLRALRLIRLLRVAKLQREMSLLANRFLSTYVFMLLRVVAALMIMLSINHIIACLWFAIGARNGMQNSWIENLKLEQAGLFEAYVVSLHWSLTQFTPSTQNVTPVDAVERLFAICVILLAMGCFSSFVGSITATVNALRSIQATKVKQNRQVLSFFASRNMSLDLYRKVQYVIRTEKLADDPVMERDVALLKLLPIRFRKQLHEEMYLGMLLHLKFWPPGVRTRESIFLTEVCHLAMEEEVARKYQDVFLPGTECHHAYIIEPGYEMSYSCGALMMDLRVTEEDSLCLISLWVEWQHRGRLLSSYGTSRYVTLESDKFATLAWRWAGPFYRYLQIFGVLLTGAVENRSQEDNEITDLPSNKEELPLLQARALRFDSILTGGGLPSPVADTGLANGLNTGMVRLRSTLKVSRGESDRSKSGAI